MDPLLFNAHDWYWIVGGTGPHLSPSASEHPPHDMVYSSARQAFVALDHPDYVRWREIRLEALGGAEPATRISSGVELEEVLRPYGITFTDRPQEAILPPVDGEVA